MANIIKLIEYWYHEGAHVIVGLAFEQNKEDIEWHNYYMQDFGNWILPEKFKMEQSADGRWFAYNGDWAYGIAKFNNGAKLVSKEGAPDILFKKAL